MMTSKFAWRNRNKLEFYQGMVDFLRKAGYNIIYLIELARLKLTNNMRYYCKYCRFK
jgi:hypothetical protein